MLERLVERKSSVLSVIALHIIQPYMSHLSLHGPTGWQKFMAGSRGERSESL